MTPTDAREITKTAFGPSTARSVITKLADQVEALTKERDADKAYIRELEDAITPELVSLRAERDEYQQAADTMAAAHKIERDALSAEVARLDAGWHKANGDTLDVALERDALMADAARYQFMKSNCRAIGLDIEGNHSWTCQITRSDIKGPTLDEAIDAALKKAGAQ